MQLAQILMSQSSGASQLLKNQSVKSLPNEGDGLFHLLFALLEGETGEASVEKREPTEKMENVETNGFLFQSQLLANPYFQEVVAPLEEEIQATIQKLRPSQKEELIFFQEENVQSEQKLKLFSEQVVQAQQDENIKFNTLKDFLEDNKNIEIFTKENESIQPKSLDKNIQDLTKNENFKLIKSEQLLELAQNKVPFKIQQQTRPKDLVHTLNPSNLLMKQNKEEINSQENKEDLQITNKLVSTEKTQIIEGTEKRLPIIKETWLGFKQDLNFTEQSNLTFNKTQLANSSELSSTDVDDFSSFLENSFSEKVEPSVPIREIPDYILKQINQSVRFNKLNGSSEINLRLKPEQLGKLTLRLAVSEGQVSVKILTETSITRDLVEQNLTHLRQSLINQGIKCSEIDVQVGSDSNFQHFQQENPFNQPSNSNKAKFASSTKEENQGEVVMENIDFITTTSLRKSLGLNNLEILA